MNRTLLFFLILLTIGQQSQSQSRWGLFAGGGTTWYYGDMNDRLITHENLLGYYWNAGLLYRVSPRFHISGRYAAGKVVGADSLAIQDFNKKRDLHFRNDIWQTSLHLEYRLLGYRNGRPRKVTPYLIGGFAYFHYNPVAILNGEEVELQPLGTEGQYIEGDGNPEPYTLYDFSIPAGLGIEFRLSNAFSARIEVINHFSFTDYFDDLSSDYADSLKLSSTPNGALAVAMANNIASGYPREGFGRGDPKDNDTYVFAGISLMWTPGAGQDDGNRGGQVKGRNNGSSSRKKKKKANCPAFD